MPQVLTLVFAAVAASFAGSAAAQAASPVLHVDSGTVMTSNGGEFLTARSGQAVQPGQQIMVAEGAKARLLYPGGCSAPLSAAGVFPVAAQCAAAAASGSATVAKAGSVSGGMSGGTAALAAVGGLAAAAAVAAALDESEEPVSR